MVVYRRGTLRHPKFSDLVEAIRRSHPKVGDIIDGAVWEIQHDPERLGIHIKEIDVWQARLVVSPPPDLLLMYAIGPRFVTMLTIIAADGSKLG
jgi:hypothetical protein